MTKSRDKIEKLQEEVAKAEKKAADISVTRKELELQENTAKIKYEQAVSIKEKQETEYNSIINDGKELENQKRLELERDYDPLSWRKHWRRLMKNWDLVKSRMSRRRNW